MILSLHWVISFEKTSEISSEIAAEFGFFPVSTKMKARWACANIPWVKILYYFISLCKNPWWVYGLLIIFSTSGFPVIIKLQPATCNLQKIPAASNLQLRGQTERRVSNCTSSLPSITLCQRFAHLVSQWCGETQTHTHTHKRKNSAEYNSAYILRRRHLRRLQISTKTRLLQQWPSLSNNVCITSLH